MRCQQVSSSAAAHPSTRTAHSPRRPSQPQPLSPALSCAHSLLTPSDTGDVADDSYVRWREDIELLANLSLNAHRFSISWPRVITAEGKVNPVAIAHYSDFIDGLIAKGITPIVTLYHGDVRTLNALAASPPPSPSLTLPSACACPVCCAPSAAVRLRDAAQLDRAARLVQRHLPHPPVPPLRHHRVQGVRRSSQALDHTQ